ncbi:MAG: ATP-binding protein [Oscillochloridaceae bacterium umkhey_bin13]
MADSSPPTEALAVRPARLYGRANEQARLRAQLAAPVTAQTSILLVQGGGGTGKTVLLEWFAEQLQHQQIPFLPIYDFYHIDNFRARAIEEAIIQALITTHAHVEPVFAAYRTARDELDRARIPGSDFRLAQDDVREAFIYCYNRAMRRLPPDQRMVLLFDTVEQAVALSDGAELAPDLNEHNPAQGGEWWLRAMLPHLRRTLVVLSGRSQTLYGQDVQLYADLDQRMPLEKLDLAGLDLDATHALALALLEQVRAHGGQLGKIADQIELDAAKLNAWYLVADGLPFWIALLMTLELMGLTADKKLDTLYANAQKHQNTAPATDPAAWNDLKTQAHELRDEVFRLFAYEHAPASQPLLLMLQRMAQLRKGLTRDLLAHILQHHGPNDADPQVLFEQLAQLVIVKQRKPLRYTSPAAADQATDQHELQIFLHDELYALLDQATAQTTTPVTPELGATLTAWYDQRIDEAENERLVAQQSWLHQPESDMTARAIWQHRRDGALRRRQQLERDVLGYAYEAEALRRDPPSERAGLRHETEWTDRGEAVARFNLLSYQAVFAHDAGHGSALHQEALRNIYRHQPQQGPSRDSSYEFAALHLLRAAVQIEDRQTAVQLSQQISVVYQVALAHPTGSALALLHLALAIADLYGGKGLDAKQRPIIQDHLDQAAQALNRLPPPDSQAEQEWHALLQAQILNFRGYFHRLVYELQAACTAYRQSVQIMRQHPNLLPEFRAITMRNLAFALAEHGELGEAEWNAQEALTLHLRYGHAYEMALDRNTLAWVEIRRGGSYQALHYSELATATMRELKSLRGKALVVPRLAEAQRKVAQQQDDNPAAQDARFAQALNLLDEIEAELHQADLQQTWLDRWREIYQTRGVVYRSWGLVRRRRAFINRQSPQSLADFAQARTYLLKALHISQAPIPVVGQAVDYAALQQARQPRLILTDIYEDLATVFVNEDVYDERLESYLAYAEALTRDYQLRPGQGLPPLPVTQPDATPSFWRELGQCELQRMLAAFGKFDFGSARFDPLTEQRIPQQDRGNPVYLEQVARHMVRMMAYLVAFGSDAPMLQLARNLALRELRLDRTEDQLIQIDDAAYQEAERYNLVNEPAFREVGTLIQTARRHLGYA